MNRFKFRCWDRELLIWLDDEILLPGETGILMQSTGEQDKNGKEIFEMDIVKWDNEHPQTKEILSSYGLVKWESAAFIIHGMIVQRPFYLPKYGSRQFHWDELEVCGNLYESKELLQKIEVLKGKA